MPTTSDALLSIGRVESVASRGGLVTVVIGLLPPGQATAADLENRRGIVATVDDVAGTRLRVRSVRLKGDALSVTLMGVPPKSRRISVKIEGLVPGRDVATVLLDRDAPPFDPGAIATLPAVAPPSRLLNYLFKDFRSFRQLMLDSISADVPGLTERHQADQLIAMIEVLAFAADHLSYYQDAVATEAYLETARRRVSVRRHARLINYAFHEGSTPRTWLQVVPKRCFTLELGFQAATSTDLTRERRVYETLESRALYPSLSEMPLWDYGDPAFLLRSGATSATVVRAAGSPGEGGPAPLERGTVLIFEQRLHVDGTPAGARFRQAVRLTKDARNFPHPSDTSRMLSHVEWSDEDSLAFDLPARVGSGARRIASLALGNIVAADFGETVQTPITDARLDAHGTLHVFTPDLTYAVPYDDGQPACAFTDIRAYRAQPQVSVCASALGSVPLDWHPRADLIGADAYDRVFVVEPELTGALLLRFGDGVNGSKPDRSSQFEVTWRQGNGSAGRIGPDAISEFDTHLDAIERVRNPLASGGGNDPLDLGKAKRQAPALVRRQRRCISDEDYLQVADDMPGVSIAVQRRWTGSGETVDLYVHARTGADRARESVRQAAEAASAIGVQVAVREPRRVGIVVELALRYTRGVNANDVAARAVAAAKAAFDAQDVTMGKPIYASWFVTAATTVRGVAQVTLTQFRRLDAAGNLETGVMRFDPTEIAVLVDEFGMVTDGRPLVVNVT